MGSSAWAQKRAHPTRLFEERTRHLESFILGYARFAKLPVPRLASTHWQPIIARLQAQVAFSIVGNLPEAPGSFDIAQMEQALVNVLKNAHESGSPPEQVCLTLSRVPGAIRLEIMDGGSNKWRNCFKPRALISWSMSAMFMPRGN